MSQPMLSPAASVSSSSVLLVQPTTAYFPPPHHNRSIRNTINLSNTSDHYLVFKVRSSNPERFVVRPTAGFVSPTSVSRLLVTLKRTDEDLTAVKRDRFRVTVKKVTASNVNPSKDDAKKVWELCESSSIELETDILCSYHTDVPAVEGVNVQFLSGEEMNGVAPSEAGGAASAIFPSSSRVSASPVATSASPLAERSNMGGRGVSFGPKLSAGLGDAAGGSMEPKTSAQEALTNAQRVKDNILTDISHLKAKEKQLREHIAAGSNKADGMTREALELEALRARVNQAKEQLTARKTLQQGAQDSGNATATAASRSGAAASGMTLSQVNRSIAPTTGNTLPLTATNLSSVGGGSVMQDQKPSNGSVYLSTVLIWMIIAYLAGAVYRAYANHGASTDLVSLLPPETREALMSISQYLRDRLM